MERFELEMVENGDRMFVSRGRLLELANGEVVYGIAGGTGQCKLFDY